jgi:hypothetical protein
VTPEIATNARSYDLPEGHITRANTEQENVRSNGESLREWMLRNEIPELRDMHVIYQEIARRLNQLAEAVDANRATASADTAEADLYSFDALPDLDALAEAQGVRPIENIDDLVTDFWPKDESVEDFIAAATEGRHEEEDEPES